jgi:hypothetical protein
VWKFFLPLLLVFGPVVEGGAWSPEASSAASKLDLLERGHATPGSTVTFTVREINAYAAAELPAYVPRGLRNPHVELGNGSITGTAVVDFVKLRQAAGQSTNWFLAKLIEGEEPVRIVTSVQSANGEATVYLRRVEIAGISVSGSALDFLVDTFVMPVFPDARVNRPFPLVGNIERVEVRPNLARALIRAQAPKPAAPPVAAARRGR